MRGRLRHKTRQQSQREIKFKQETFEGGYVNDLPGTDLPKDAMALLENFNGYQGYVEGRSGSQKYSNTALPGSGTIHALAQHSTSKKWVLHRGGRVYYADTAQATWTDLLLTASFSAPTVNGDASNQLSGVLLTQASTTNTNAYTLYWNLTNSGSTRTLSVYSNSGKTTLVAQGTRSGNGFMFLHQKNSSGLGGNLTVTYTTDDTDSGNTFLTGTTDGFLNLDTDSRLEVTGNDFYLFVKAVDSTCFDAYVDLTNNRLYKINAGNSNGYGGNSLPGSGSQSTSTPYGYRYIYTFSRIVNATTGLRDTSVDRVSGSLIFEGPANNTVNINTNLKVDYGEYWLANTITASNPNTLNLTPDGLLAGANNLFTFAAASHYTHISIYRTLDIGVNGTDPVTGSGNNREVYIWVGDFDYTVETASDIIPDDQLRARLSNDFGLRTRFWKEIPTGEVGVISNNFLYAAQRGQNTISYGQLTHKEHIGFYVPVYQFLKVNDGIQFLLKSPDMISIICANKTYISSPNSYTDVGGNAIASIFVLQHLALVSDNIGCTDWGSFAAVDAGTQSTLYGAYGYSSYIAHCSDHTIRIWNHSMWGEDLSTRKVNRIVQQMTVGSVGSYCRGVYLLWYRTDSSQTNNNLCLRFGMSADTGSGWSKVSGSAWVVAPTYTGAGVFLDANNIQRQFAVDAVDSFAYWIETFTSYVGSGLTRTFKDKVATDGTGGTTFTCYARFREITSDEEDDTIYHEEAHIYDRPFDESVGYPSGFSRNYLVYVDGSTTAAATLTAPPAKGDLQFFDTITGRRIQPEVQFNQSGARLTGFDCFIAVEDKVNVGATPSTLADATAQANLAQNMKVWLTRPLNLLNRASGKSFTLSGTAPTNVTGPEGKTYGLSFVTGASYSIADTTSYTDFAVHFWCKSVTTGNRIFQITGTNSFYATFTNATTLSLNGAGNITVNTIASGWHDFWIIRSGSTVTVYQNGALLSGTVTVATARGGTSFDINPDAATMSLYDIRVYTATRAASDITYYYNDVTPTLLGNKVLPLG